MADLLADQEDQETRWASDIQQARLLFEGRVHAAMKFARNKAKRKAYYAGLRNEIGSDAAREVAKTVEGIIYGTARYPHWFQSMRLPGGGAR